MAEIDVVEQEPAERLALEAACAASVLHAYTAAMGRSQRERAAFDAAVGSYLVYHPNMQEQAARLAVARIIAWKE